MKMLLKIIYRLLFVLVPKSRMGDKVIAYYKFLRKQKRLPTKGFMNDVLFKIKTSNEILNVERQYTSDKELVKLYIAQAVGNDKNVPTKAVLRSEAEVLAYEFSKGEVVKPTHASGLVKFIGNDPIDKNELISWLSINYYDTSREINYRYLKPKIIVEESLFGRTNVDDIKFFCVNGRVKVIQWDFDRHSNHTRMLYNRNWDSMNASLKYPLSTKSITKPSKLGEMIEVAEELSKPFSFVRVDLYYDEQLKKFYVGEITHCHGSSNEKFNNKEAEKRVAKELFS